MTISKIMNQKIQCYACVDEKLYIIKYGLCLYGHVEVIYFSVCFIVYLWRVEWQTTQP